MSDTFTQYELPDAGSINLVPANQVLPQLYHDSTRLDFFNRRASRLFQEFGQEGSTKLGMMIPDLAASDIDDDEILRLAKARMKMLEPGVRWWERLGGSAASAGAGAIAGSFVVPVVGTVIGAVAGAIAGAIKPDLPNELKEQTVDRAAKAITGDETMDVGALISASFGELNNDSRWTQYWETARGERNWQRDVAGQLGTAERATVAVGNILGDPLMALGVGKTVSTSGAVIGKGTPVGVGRGLLFKARTSEDDLARVLRGEAKFSDVFFRDQPFSDVVKAALGKTTSGQNLVRRIAQADGPADVGRLFSARTPLDDTAKVLLWKAGREGGEEGVVDKLVRLADPSEAFKLEPELVAMGGTADALHSHAAFMDLADEQLKRFGINLGPQSEALRDRAKFFDMEKLRIDHEMSSIGRVDRLPKASMTRQMREWYDGTNWAQQSGVWSLAGMKQINSGLRAAGRPTGRSLRGSVAMNPHGAVRPDDPFASEQLLRFGREMELSSQTLRGKALGRVGSWAAEDTTTYTNKFLAASDDMAKRGVLEDMQKTYAERVGLSSEQYETVLGEWKQRGHAFITDAYVNKKGKVVTDTQPVIQADLLNQVPILPVSAIREMGTWGPEVLGNPAQAAKAFKGLGDKFNTAWKVGAVAKPSWLTRVVLLSEMPRNALAGNPNPITHPVAHLVSADLFRSAGALEKAAKSIPGGEDLVRGVSQFATGEKLGIVEKASLANKVWVDKRAAGSLRPGAAKTPDMPDYFQWKDVKHLESKFNDEAHFYKEGWLKQLNDHYANDPLMRQFATATSAGAKVDDVVEAAKAWAQSAAGHSWRVANGITDPAKVGKEISRRYGAFKRMTRGDKKVARKMGHVTMEDVATLDPPDVLPSWIWAGSFRRPGRNGPMQDVFKRGLSTFFDKASAEPSFYLNRQGPVRYHFVNELSRMAALAESKGVNIDVQKIVASASKDATVTLSAAERKLSRAAFDAGIKKTKDATYDLAESSRAADFARFVAPFGNAWQEEITRWGMLAFNRPHIPIAIANTWAERRSLPITTIDPRTNIAYIHIPFGESISRFATGKWNPLVHADEGLAFPLLYPWDSVNLLTGNSFLPGGGPWIQIPAAIVQKRAPSMRESLTALNPFSTTNLFDQLAPTVVRETAKAGEDEGLNFARAFKSAYIVALDNAKGDPSKVDPEEVARQAKALRWLGAVTNLTLGGGARPQLPPKIRDMVAYSQWLSHTLPPDLADEVFLGRYGVEAGAWLQGLTKSMTGQPPTREAEQYLLDAESKPYADKYGKVFWTFMAEKTRGDFDPIAFHKQIDEKGRDVLDPKEFVTASQNLVGWYRYSNLLEAREQAMAQLGIYSTSQKDYKEKISPWFQAEVGKLDLTYPTFKEDREANMSKRQFQREELLRKSIEFVAEPWAQNLEGVKGMKQYLEARVAIRTVAAAANIGSFNSKESLPFRQTWTGIVSTILNQHPDFRFAYARLGLEFDDVLGD